MRAEAPPSRASLLIAGVHVESIGYPNVTYRLAHMRRANTGRLAEVNFPFRRRGFERHAATGWKPLRLLGSLLRLAMSHVVVLTKIVARRGTGCLYIPYPAVFLLYGLSLLPRRWQPRHIIADAFISLYDTVVQDRGLLSANGPWARLLKRVETRAYAHADTVIVDTSANAEFFANCFHLANDRILAAPLSTDETTFYFAPYHPRTGRVRVLFVGTFVPLQGVETIARAALLLRERADIEFLLVGDGQDGRRVEAILSDNPCPNLTWMREWQTSTEVSQYIRDADVCLGIFGTGDKASRVWPLKNYAYMAVGRPIITADTACARQLAAHASVTPFVSCAPGDPEALAAAIDRLARDPGQRAAMASASRALYEQRLANDRGFALLDDAMRSVCMENDAGRP